MSDEQARRTYQLECSCGWEFEADTESLAYKRRISHRQLCDEGRWVKP